MKQFYIYIMTNAGGTVLYVGMTNDLAERVRQHIEGTGGRFTSRYRVTRLLYFESFHDVRLAIARENEIKGWRRSKKEELIRRMNPELLDLKRDLR